MLISYNINFISLSIIIFIFQNCLFLKINGLGNLLKNEYVKERFKRSIRNMGKLNLTLPIKYFISENVKKETIQKAINIIQTETCITFLEQFEFFSSQGFLFMLDSESRVSVGPSVENMSQPIVFSPQCNHDVGCILNLIGHALGISYTHNRPDRDNYIKIIYKHIGQMDKYIFEKTPSQNDLTYGTSYDFGSLMHEKKMCRKHHYERIFETKLSPFYIYMIGQRYALSFNDVKLLNYYYCSKVCKNKKLKCHNNAYSDSHNCNECKCPNGYSGRTCKEVPKISSNCGKIKLAASRISKTIKGKGNKTCTYHIGAKQKRKIKLIIKYVKTDKITPCFQKMGLEVKYRKDKGTTGLCLCGYFKNIKLISEDNHVMIQYNGRSNRHMYKIKYKEVR